MQLRRFSVPAAVFLAVLAAGGTALGQNKPAGRPKPAKQVKPAAKSAAKPKKAPKAEPEKVDDGAAAAGSAAGEDAPKPTGEGESQVKAAGTSATQDAAGSKAATSKKDATTEEDKEGIKTYHFGAIEVESRLKSPQLIYFLRRVRAEFDAGALGHRSFLGELSDTRNDSAFR